MGGSLSPPPCENDVFKKQWCHLNMLALDSGAISLLFY
jgi:hypothetical protein